ncbi:uncharacterized protein LOC101745508 [Bombyx mori]
MKGVKCAYKRDAYWRTWRTITNSTGEKQIVCYKCQNYLKKTCPKCHSGGVWIIDESSPPCPFEIFSVEDDSKICAHNILKQNDSTKECPLYIKITDVSSSCDNPITTKWIVTRDYGSLSEQFPVVICNGREYCQFSTLYTITPKHISFKIINEMNEIILSRIMNNGGLNYVCVNDCGTLDPSTKKVIKQEKPYSFDLFQNVGQKNKRENEAWAAFDNFDTNVFNYENDLGLHGYVQESKEKPKEIKSHCKELVHEYLN